MTCREFQTHAAPYVDGELGVDQTLAAQAHVADCPRCAALSERERQFRQLLRRQPREGAPPEFRARILAALRRDARTARLRRWAPPALATAALAASLVVLLLHPAVFRSPGLVGELVAQHVVYAQVERPAEYVSSDQAALEDWLRQRAGFRVTVPDYSQAGIRLVGGRLAGVRGQKAAYVLYDKGHTLLSVFMLPTAGLEAELDGRVLRYRGHEYRTQEWKGYRTVSWSDGRALFGLVSMLDYDALLECADALREARARETRL
jgi:mycothiol system anti-sigma-R factor